MRWSVLVIAITLWLPQVVNAQASKSTTVKQKENGHEAAPLFGTKKKALHVQKLSPEHKAEKAKQIERIRKTDYKEYLEGNLSDADAYAVLWAMLSRHLSIGTRDSKECQRVLRDLQALQMKHPEYIRNPRSWSLELPSERRKRKAQERQRAAREAALEEKLKTWVPADDYGYFFVKGNQLAILYQFRLEFYTLPQGTEVLVANSDGRSVPLAEKLGEKWFVAGRPIFKGKPLKPFKEVRFSQPVRPQHNWSPPASERSIVVISTDAWTPDGYAPNNPEEGTLVEKLVREGRVIPRPWKKHEVDYDAFYGVYSVSGEELVRLDGVVEVPGRVLLAYAARPDGTEALWLVGRVTSTEEIGPWFGDPYEVVRWTKEGGVSVIPLKEARGRLELLEDMDWE